MNQQENTDEKCSRVCPFSQRNCFPECMLYAGTNQNGKWVPNCVFNKIELKSLK